MKHTDKSIQSPDWLYNLLRPTVDGLFRLSMRRYRCLGREHVPASGRIIYAPNHQNGLLDALAVLSLDRSAKVFVSRADIHRNPRVARILRWLKIMPINRMRDGIAEVRHNDATMQRAVEVLGDGVPFCIMPEGTHRQRHSLLPLQKGIFRIALQAIAADPDTPLWIVPVGLEYGDWARMWDSLTVQIGAPILVNDYLAQHPDQTEPQQLLGLRTLLTERMRSLILWVADDAHYDEAWATLDRHRPALYEKPRPRLPRWARVLLLATGAPLFVLSALVTLPIWLTIYVATRPIEDVAMRNTVAYVIVWLMTLLSLGVLLPFWCYVQEYLYQCTLRS